MHSNFVFFIYIRKSLSVVFMFYNFNSDTEFIHFRDGVGTFLDTALRGRIFEGGLEPRYVVLCTYIINYLFVSNVRFSKLF